MSKIVCANCKTEMQFAGQIGRREECSKCGNDLHACVNCIHYSKNAYNECKETQADVVKEKDRANFCDYFSPTGEAGGSAKTAVDLKAAAEALFKKS
jgi:hypothetical protein